MPIFLCTFALTNEGKFLPKLYQIQAMKKRLIYAVAALAIIAGGCSKGNKSADSAESAAAKMEQLEAARSEAYKSFRTKTIGAMSATVEAVKADPENAEKIYTEFISRMQDMHLQNAEFLQELLIDSTYIQEGRKFQAAMAEVGIDTNKLQSAAASPAASTEAETPTAE